MREQIKELIQDFIYYESEDLFNHELNYNNADPTSKQRCYSLSEIKNIFVEEMKKGGINGN